MLVFDAAQFDGILKKFSEFNNTLQSASVSCVCKRYKLFCPAIHKMYIILYPVAC